MTSFVFTLTHSIFPGRECEHTNRLFISVQFRLFCCRVRQGKRLSEFLQKYIDSGTETTYLAGYNILVFKYVKISAGLNYFWGQEGVERDLLPGRFTLPGLTN